jgi:uncharacterized membrane protein YfcA
MAGSFVGKAIVQRMSAHAFERVIDVVLLIAGVALIGAAAH